jgi:AcrR family transcriptional regulator
MARTKDPAVRTQLLDQAAHMLRTRQPVTLRALVAGTGVSTMAVYTYFGGMDGLWKALRQESFTRLAAKLAAVQMTTDPVRDLAALGSAYVANALESPDLYRVMFDAGFELEDPGAADETLNCLVRTVERGKTAGRFRDETDPAELATQSWTIGHGLASLVVTGPLPHQALTHAVPMLTALFTSAGDDPANCRRSVKHGWGQLRPAGSGAHDRGDTSRERL